MPAKHRDTLLAQYEGRITLVQHPDHCLLVYPRPLWESKRAELAAHHPRILQMLLIGTAEEVEIDAAGRFLVPAELRTAAALERDAMLLGMGERLELWDCARLDAYYKEPERAKALADAAEKFAF